MPQSTSANRDPLDLAKTKVYHNPRDGASSRSVSLHSSSSSFSSLSNDDKESLSYEPANDAEGGRQQRQPLNQHLSSLPQRRVGSSSSSSTSLLLEEGEEEALMVQGGNGGGSGRNDEEEVARSVSPSSRRWFTDSPADLDSLLAFRMPPPGAGEEARSKSNSQHADDPHHHVPAGGTTRRPPERGTEEEQQGSLPTRRSSGPIPSSGRTSGRVSSSSALPQLPAFVPPPTAYMEQLDALQHAYQQRLDEDAELMRKTTVELQTQFEQELLEMERAQLLTEAVSELNNRRAALQERRARMLQCFATWRAFVQYRRPPASLSSHDHHHHHSSIGDHRMMMRAAVSGEKKKDGSNSPNGGEEAAATGITDRIRSWGTAVTVALSVSDRSFSSVEDDDDDDLQPQQQQKQELEDAHGVSVQRETGGREEGEGPSAVVGSSSLPIISEGRGESRDVMTSSAAVGSFSAAEGFLQRVALRARRLVPDTHRPPRHPPQQHTHSRGVDDERNHSVRYLCSRIAVVLWRRTQRKVWAHGMAHLWNVWSADRAEMFQQSAPDDAHAADTCRRLQAVRSVRTLQFRQSEEAGLLLGQVPDTEIEIVVAVTCASTSLPSSDPPSRRGSAVLDAAQRTVRGIVSTIYAIQLDVLFVVGPLVWRLVERLLPQSVRGWLSFACVSLFLHLFWLLPTSWWIAFTVFAAGSTIAAFVWFRDRTIQSWRSGAAVMPFCTPFSRTAAGSASSASSFSFFFLPSSSSKNHSGRSKTSSITPNTSVVLRQWKWYVGGGEALARVSLWEGLRSVYCLWRYAFQFTLHQVRYNSSSSSSLRSGKSSNEEGVRRRHLFAAAAETTVQWCLLAAFLLVKGCLFAARVAPFVVMALMVVVVRRLTLRRVQENDNSNDSMRPIEMV